MPTNIALPQGLIPPIGWLSKSLMQTMAQLAEGTSREEAAILLKENVSQRTGRLTRTAHTHLPSGHRCGPAHVIRRRYPGPSQTPASRFQGRRTARRCRIYDFMFAGLGVCVRAPSGPNIPVGQLFYGIFECSCILKVIMQQPLRTWLLKNKPNSTKR